MPVLRVTSGPAAGQSIPVESQVIIGRENADLTIDDPELSRHHAAVRPAEPGVVIEDLGSTNGTFVNGQLIREPVMLSTSGTIRVGLTEIEVEVAPAAAEPTYVQEPPPPPAIPVAPAEPTPQVAEPQAAAPVVAPPPPAPPAEPTVPPAAPAAPPAEPAPDAASPPERKRPPVLLFAIVGLLVVAGVAVGLVFAFRGEDSAKKRQFVGTARTTALEPGLNVTVVGLLQARPTGRMSLIIQRRVNGNPRPGGLAVPLLFHMVCSQPGGSFVADFVGTVQITRTGRDIRDIEQGLATVSQGTGTYKNVEGSFTIEGNNKLGQISRFRLQGTLEY